jgi:hypothetical protein
MSDVISRSVQNWRILSHRHKLGDGQLLSDNEVVIPLFRLKSANALFASLLFATYGGILFFIRLTNRPSPPVNILFEYDHFTIAGQQRGLWDRRRVQSALGQDNQAESV